MQTIPLHSCELNVTPICLGTMTFGEQVGEADAHAILDRSLARGVTFLDTAEMYAVPARAETCGATETIIGNWFARNPGSRQRVVLATKVAGPARGMPWLRGEVSKAGIIEACEASLRRLRTDVIDLYQIHWPARNVPAFGSLYFDPAKDRAAPSIEAQLQAMAELLQAGKVRAIGASNFGAARLDAAGAGSPFPAFTLPVAEVSRVVEVLPSRRLSAALDVRAI